MAVAATEVRTPGIEGLEVLAGSATAEEIKPEGRLVENSETREES